MKCYRIFVGSHGIWGIYIRFRELSHNFCYFTEFLEHKEISWNFTYFFNWIWKSIMRFNHIWWNIIEFLYYFNVFIYYLTVLYGMSQNVAEFHKMSDSNWVSRTSTEFSVISLNLSNILQNFIVHHEMSPNFNTLI